MTVQIRNAGLGDFPVVQRCIQTEQTLHSRHRPDIFRPMELPLTEAKFAQMLADPTQSLLLACVDGMSAGICFAEQLRSKNPILTPRLIVYINDFVVLDAFQRQGVGRALYEEMKQRADALGAQSLELKVWALNETAVQFYQNLGMQVQCSTMEVLLGNKHDGIHS